MAAAQYFEQVQKIFIAFYQRPADPAGLKYWAERVDAAGGDINQVINAFASSPEAVDLYGAIDATTDAAAIRTVIDKLYLALFDAPADFDAAGKQFYVDGFMAGTFTAGSIALSVLNGAQNDDLIAVNNKVQVANEFTQQVDGRAMSDAYFGNGTSFNVTYAGEADAIAARDILKGVTFLPSTVISPSQVTEALKTQIADITDPIQGQTGGQTFMLTTGVDTGAAFKGGSGNDTYTAADSAISGQVTTAPTFTALDNLDGGAGTDTLNIIQTAAMPNVPSATVKDIEIANLTSGAAIGATGVGQFDTSGWTGLTNLNVTKSIGGAFLKAANTTDVTVADSTGTVETSGGKSVTIAKKMTIGADIITVDGAGDVTITATDSAAAAGDITVGGTTAVTGAVNVTSTGGKIVNGAAPATILDDIVITGGTTVSVTQSATSDMGDVATKGVGGSVKQGAVTVTGGNATTSVTVVQADQVALAVAAAAAKAAVSATQTVTFKGMAIGDSITIDGLTFTAAKKLTAAEAAAAFAGLTAVENQGQGFSSNGIYTGVTSANWNTSAVTGDTVTYSQKVAGTGTLAAPTATGVGVELVAAVPTPTAAAGATAVVGNPAVIGVLGVSNGVVTIDDNATAASIKTIVVDGYDAGATLGATAGKNLNALTHLTLANSGAGTAAVTTNAATLNLTVNDVTAGVTLTDASLKTLNITTATKDSKFTLATVTTVEALNVDGTNAVDLQATALSGLKTVTVSGAAGLSVDASAASVTSVTTTTTGTVNATIDSSKATYTGGAGVDNVTFSNTTAATKAVTLGGGDDKLTLVAGTTATPTVTIDGGAGTDTLAMAAADAATVSTGTAFASKFTSFEKLSLGAVALGTTASVDLVNMNNIKYVVSAGATAAAGGSTETALVTFKSLKSGQSVDVAGRIVTATGGDVTAAEVEAAYLANATAGNAAVSGTLTGWTVATDGTVGNGILKFDATTAGNVADITTTSTNSVAPTAPVVVTTPGITPVTESSVVSFVGLMAGEAVTAAGRTVTATAVTESVSIQFTALTTGQVLTIGGMTVTSTAGAADAADLANTFAGGVSTNVDLVVTGSTGVVGYTAGTTAADTVFFESTTVGADVGDLAVSGTAAGTVTVARTQGSNGNLNAAQVASAMGSGTSSGAAVVTSSLTGFTAGTAVGNKVTFTSTTADTPVTDIAVTTTAGTTPAVVTTNGVAGATEYADVTFQSLKSGQSVNVAGRIVTATNGDVTAAQVEAAYLADTTAGNAVVSGTLASWTVADVGTAIDGVLRFTSTTVNNDTVTDIVTTTAAAPAPTVAGVATTPGGVGAGVAGALTLTKMANDGTLEFAGLTADSAGATVTMTDATSLTADSFNIVTKVDTANRSFGTVDVAGVETINITATDVSPKDITVGSPTFGKPTIQTATLTLKDAALKSVVVTGESNLALNLDANVVALTSVDASAFKGNLSYVAAVDTQVVKGGSGADNLTANADDVTLNGGAGNDTLTVNAGADRAILTGGAGVDTFVIAGAATLSSVYATITAVEAGDIIKFAGATAFEATKVTLSAGATETTQALMDLAVNNLGANGMGWFQTGGNTFIVMDAGADSTAGFVAGIDMVVMITGIHDLSKASFSGTLGTLEIA